MLVQGERVEAEFLAVAIFVEEVIVVVGGLFAIEKLI